LFTDDTSALNDADSFLDKGILDSMGILEVIAFLKDEFNITVADSEVIPENLDSIENLCKFTESKI
jgi:acyl carrier protein